MTNPEVWLENVYKVHLASVRLEHYVEPRASIMTTYEPYTDFSGLLDYYSFSPKFQSSFVEEQVAYLSFQNELANQGLLEPVPVDATPSKDPSAFANLSECALRGYPKE